MSILKKVKGASVSDIQKENPEAYESIFKAGAESVSQDTEALAAVQKENEELKAQVESLNKDFSAKIKAVSFASKYNLSDKAQELLSEGKTVVEVYEYVAENAQSQTTETEGSEANTSNLEQMSKVFEQTAPPAAGDGTSEFDVENISSFAEACDFVRKRENCSKAESVRIARKEYAKIWNKEYAMDKPSRYEDDESLEDARQEDEDKTES